MARMAWLLGGRDLKSSACRMCLLVVGRAEMWPARERARERPREVRTKGCSYAQKCPGCAQAVVRSGQDADRVERRSRESQISPIWRRRSESMSTRAAILACARRTVEWPRSPRRRPMSASERGVCCRRRYAATWRACATFCLRVLEERPSGVRP